MHVLPALVSLALAADPRVDPAVAPATRFHLRVTSVATPSLPRTGWVLTRPDGSELAASDVRLRTRAAALVPEGWPYRSVPERVALVAFDTPWASAAGTYTLRDGADTWTFAWDPALDLSPTLHLSTGGARPDAPEILALASLWNVDGPPVVLDHESWEVVDEGAGSVVRTGTWYLRAPANTTHDDAYSNSFTRAHVYEADLTGLPPGSYHLRWPGVGRSWTFRVADDAWDTPFRTVLAGLLHQRCGIALPPELTRWPRTACHLAPVERTTADYRVVGEDAFTALPAAATGSFVDVPGGYHDAADYDQNIGHLAVVHALTELYEGDPVKFANDRLGLPESANGLPDVLDEALWAMAPWAALQDADGGVPGGIGTTGYPAYDTMPDADTGPFYATAADPLSSYVFAAAGAALSRSLTRAGEDVAANDWRARAELAWLWAEAHPASRYDTRVAAAHAAAQLAWTTGDPAYADTYRVVGPFRDSLGWTYMDWDPTVWDDGLWAITHAAAAPSDLRDAARRVLVQRADDLVSETDERSVPLAVRPYSAVAFGSATTPRESRALFRAWALTGARDYLRVGSNTAAHTLGLNATGNSWVTGLGPNAVRHPLHTPSLADGIDDPVAGIPLYGPATYDSSNGILGAALAAYDPPVNAWPLHERYADVDYVPVYNEFTVAESLAPTLYAFGVLAALADDGTDDTGSADTGVTYDSGSTDSATESDTSGDDHGAADGADVASKGGCGCASTRDAGSRAAAGIILTAMMLARRRETRRG